MMAVAAQQVAQRGRGAGPSDDILMHIARLTDPPKSYHKQNLTVQVLPKMLPQAGPSSLTSSP
jgi:hypothetical protein